VAADIWNVGQEQINNLCERSFQQQQIIGKEDLVNSTRDVVHEIGAKQNGLRQQGTLVSPLSRFPLRGKAGAGGFPPRRKHAARQQRALAPIDAAGSPRKRAPPPCAIPQVTSADVLLHVAPWSGMFVRDKRAKDGRHVGLDFYDLLIEAFSDSAAPGMVNLLPLKTSR
jgi:hypothetical protein